MANFALYPDFNAIVQQTHVVTGVDTKEEAREAFINDESQFINERIQNSDYLDLQDVEEISDATAENLLNPDSPTIETFDDNVGGASVFIRGVNDPEHGMVDIKISVTAEGVIHQVLDEDGEPVHSGWRDLSDLMT